jgi:hypothetical protein
LTSYASINWSAKTSSLSFAFSTAAEISAPFWKTSLSKILTPLSRTLALYRAGRAASFFAVYRARQWPGDVPHSVENGEAVAAIVTILAHAASSSICLFELFDASA